jgi:hypothetical protein
MNKKEIWQAVELALRADKKAKRTFPDHVAGMAGKVVAPAGELMQHALHFKYGAEDMKEVEKNLMQYSAIQTIIQTIRFLENLQ